MMTKRRKKQPKTPKEQPVPYVPLDPALVKVFTGGFSELRYGINLHAHRFAAWAASRAASVVNCRFSVAQGRIILEECGFNASFSSPEQLPEPQAIDEQHRKWRADILSAAASRGLTFTHGVAAKLVNVYFKSRFVCGGHHDDERVRALHPPIDSVLLEALVELNVGGHASAWKQAAKTRWSRFGSEDYEHVIQLIRQSLNGAPLWMIEAYWRGNQ